MDKTTSGHISRAAQKYDNTKLAVVRVLGDGKRQRTRAFSELTSHDLFADRFGRPGKGNDTDEIE
jgi:transposase